MVLLVLRVAEDEREDVLLLVPAAVLPEDVPRLTVLLFDDPVLLARELPFARERPAPELFISLMLYTPSVQFDVL